MNCIHPSSLLFQLIQWKKRQAALLFAAWDVDDEGCIPASHLRPLLHSLFPPPLEPSRDQSATAQQRLLQRYREALSIQRIRHAFRSSKSRSDTQFPWSNSTSSRSILTLSELQATIDYLCRYDFIQRVEIRVMNAAESLSEPEELFGTTVLPTNGAPNDEIPLHESDAFALLLGELERVYAECVVASRENGVCTTPTSASLRMSPSSIQHISEEINGKGLTHHEAAAVSSFFSAAFDGPATTTRVLRKTHFLAAILGCDEG